MRDFRFLGICLVSYSSLFAADFPEPVEPSAEHRFLQRFVGDWNCENKASFPGAAPITSKGTMTCRMVGRFWLVLDVTAESDPKPYRGHGMYGFDSQKTKKCTGTWADSTSPFLWKYQGEIEGNKLIMRSQGPDPTDESKMITTVDTWEFKKDGSLILSSEMKNSDGRPFGSMKSICRPGKSAKDK